MTTPNPPLPHQIYVIRHGEKPADPPAPAPGHPTPPSGPPFGVDADGNQDAHSLLPRGWQRSGALAVLFNPAVGASEAGLRTPTALYSPSYGAPDKTQAHCTFQTIPPVPEGQELALAEAILASGGRVMLICWDHDHIPALAQAIPTVDASSIPSAWPGGRFDVVWTFGLDPASGHYAFGQVPQQLLEGDTDTVI